MFIQFSNHVKKTTIMKILYIFLIRKKPLHPPVEMRILTWALPYQIVSLESLSPTATQFSHAPATHVFFPPTSSFPHKP